jgi:DNA-binding NarL/FixJ family response regulator
MAADPAWAPRTDWGAVAEALQRADEAGTLDAEQLSRLGLALELTGRSDEAVHAWDRAHRAHAAAGDRAAAARCVFWIGFTLDSRGRGAQTAAWGARLAELAADAPPDSPTVALLTLARAASGRHFGDGGDPLPLFEEAARLAERHGDSDLLILALMGCGRALVERGETDRGFACMDRVMLEIGSGRAGDLVAGAGYCAVIASCMTRRDVERAREWTGALSDWCDAQVGLVPFRGACLLHRATLLQIGGAWPEARSILHGLGTSTIGTAPGESLYRDAELLRLTGRGDEAEGAYRSAADAGRDPQPGLALLRLQQGRTAAAVAGVARSLSAGPPLNDRADLLEAACRIRLAAGDAEGARSAAEELQELAGRVRTSYLQAQADRSLGRVLVAEEHPAEALPLLRRAWSGWFSVGAPYEAAVTRVIVAAAARALGDEDAAGMELAAARRVFAELGAVPDLQQIDEAAGADERSSEGPLTPREVEVVRLLARGLSNREIASRLFLSERTVARHVGNVLAKLQLANRAAVTAFAYEHRLVLPAD